LIDGHLRAQTAGDQLIPVLVLDVTAEEADKLLATMDPIGAMAKTDPEMLNALVAEMRADHPDAADLLNNLAKQASAALAELAVTEDDTPAPFKAAVTRPGDLWLLESTPKRGHRLLCGDSTTKASVERVMDGRRAELVATDPPYLVDYTGARPEGTGKDWSAVYREVEIRDAASFFGSVFERIVEIAAPRAALYCWHAHKRARMIEEAWDRVGILSHQQIIWVKPTPVFGRVFWHFRHEPCLMGWIRGKQPLHDGDQSINSVWEIPALDSRLAAGSEYRLGQDEDVWYIDWEGKSRVVGNEHPTQKPLEIFARPMRKHTRIGSVVFEPFSGSGSQLIAAEQLGRRCFAIELEPVFVDVAVRRWQNLTGQHARLDGDGRTWTEIAQERGVKLE
jgi:DNA modification methylase